MRNRPDLLLSTHPNFSSLMWLHQRLTGIYSWCAALGIDVWTLPDGLTRCSLPHLQLLLPVSRSFEHPTPMEGAASAQARDLGVAGQVIFTGRLEDAELVEHYRLATVFALPSEKEGFGIVFLVMMAFG
jgi:hypothetical protein